MTTEDQLRESIRAQRGLREEDIEAIADKVVEKMRDVFMSEIGKLAWDVVRKFIIGGVMALMAIDQLKWLLK